MVCDAATQSDSLKQLRSGCCCVLTLQRKQRRPALNDCRRSGVGNGSDGLLGKQPLFATSALTIVGESQSSWRTTPVICSFIRLADILVPQLKLAIYVMRSFTNLPSTISPFVLAAVLASAVGVVAMSIRAFESEGAKAKRLELKRRRRNSGHSRAGFRPMPAPFVNNSRLERWLSATGTLPSSYGSGRTWSLRHSTVAERTESPESSLEWILEIDCLKPSVAVCAT